VEQDTSPEQMRRYHERLRAMEPWQRLRTAASLSKGVRRLAEAGLRMRHPGASDQEIRVRLVVRLYGRPAGIRLFGTVPDNAL
jgi:hypothetical protein